VYILLNIRRERNVVFTTEEGERPIAEGAVAVLTHVGYGGSGVVVIVVVVNVIAAAGACSSKAG